MATSRHYELVLLLDPELEDSARDKIAADVRSQVESGGTIEHEDSWGVRKLAFEIGQRNEAEYRFWRFQASGDVLDRLDHNLKIADGVLRFRVFRVDASVPTTPPPATPQPAAVASERPERHRSRE